MFDACATLSVFSSLHVSDVYMKNASLNIDLYATALAKNSNSMEKISPSPFSPFPVFSHHTIQMPQRNCMYLHFYPLLGGTRPINSVPRGLRPKRYATHCHRTRKLHFSRNVCFHFKRSSIKSKKA